MAYKYEFGHRSFRVCTSNITGLKCIEMITYQKINCVGLNGAISTQKNTV